MNIQKSLRAILIEQMWSVLKIGQSEAEQIIATMEKENHFHDNIQNESDIAIFIKGNLQLYLYPNNLSRLKIYDQKFLNDNNIVLDFIKLIPDGWDCNLYFDKKKNLYWEDNYGRYTKEGFKISPYVEPLKIYK
jgi:hypothetical protein